MNEAFVRLGVEYAGYLEAGGTPLLGVVAKYTADGADAGTDPDRVQSLHDNLLGNLDIASMMDKFLGAGDGGSNPSPIPGLYDALYALVDAEGLVGRPIYSGNEGAANNALPFDIAHGLVPISGTLTATDVDDGATLTWSGEGLDGAYGTFTLGSDGTWTYTADPALVQPLGVGESAIESFIATVTDEHGASELNYRRRSPSTASTTRPTRSTTASPPIRSPRSAATCSTTTVTVRTATSTSTTC